MMRFDMIHPDPFKINGNDVKSTDGKQRLLYENCYAVSFYSFQQCRLDLLILSIVAE